MWNYNNLPPQMHLDQSTIKRFKKYAKISGVFFIVLGLVGIFLPYVLSLTTLMFVMYLMLITGVMSAWMTWTTNRNDWAGWLKSIMLIGSAILMLIYPMEGVAVLGLLFSIYFFMDAFAGFGLAFSLKPAKGWWIWLLNAITSLLLGALFLYGWPMNSIVLVGLFVGISLIFDGIALLSGVKIIDSLDKEA